MSLDQFLTCPAMRSSTHRQQVLCAMLRTSPWPKFRDAVPPNFSCMGHYHQRRAPDWGDDMLRLSSSSPPRLLRWRLPHTARCWHTNDQLRCIDQVGLPSLKLSDIVMLHSECFQMNDRLSQFVGVVLGVTFVANVTIQPFVFYYSIHPYSPTCRSLPCPLDVCIIFPFISELQLNP